MPLINLSLTAGIVGLPNVGKSTLFNAITKNNVLAENYPFATIDPNVGVVEVPDERLMKISQMINPKKTVPTTFEFTDIAGLVKGASKGEGLGNQFLSHIRNCDAICMVVRCFTDSGIIHVDGSLDPLRDIETIGLELMLADLEAIEKRLPKIEKKALLGIEDATEYHILKRFQETLLAEKPLRSLSLAKEELKTIKAFNFLTLKPLMYIANISDNDLYDLDACENYQKLLKFAAIEQTPVVPICAKIEAELNSLSNDERALFLKELGLNASGLDLLIKASYELLGLQTYFTAGEKEVKAWTFVKGMTAPECAGIIHSDFERGFIRAETVSCNDFFEAGSYVKAKEKGRVRQEGKEYLVQDGDMILFRFNV